MMELLVEITDQQCSNTEDGESCAGGAGLLAQSVGGQGGNASAGNLPGDLGGAGGTGGGGGKINVTHAGLIKPQELGRSGSMPKALEAVEVQFRVAIRQSHKEARGGLGGTNRIGEPDAGTSEQMEITHQEFSVKALVEVVVQSDHKQAEYRYPMQGQEAMAEKRQSHCKTTD